MKKIGNFISKPSREIGDSVVSIGFECMDRQVIRPECCYDLLGESGIKYARVQTGWAICEKEKGVIDFTWLDRIVDNLLERGVKVWFNVGFGNPVYMDNLPNPTGVGCVPLYYGDECLEAWKRFARALGEHYKGRVTHYEIWNEPDIAHFWHPEKPDGAKYAELVRLTAAELRAVDPDVKIGTCTAGCRVDYIKALAEKLRPGEIDFNCFHEYVKTPEIYRTEQFKAAMAQFRACGHENISYWMGEGGYPSWAYDGHWMNFKKGNNCSERQQAEYQLRMYLTNVALGLEMISFFQIADMWERPYEKATEVLAKPAAQGILNGKTYTPKNSYFTLSRLANLLTDDVHAVEAYFEPKLSGATVLERFALMTHAYRRGDEIFVAYWLAANIEDEIDDRDGFELTLTCFEDCGLPAEPVLVDLYSGEIFELEPTLRTENRLGFKELPIGGLPFVICSRNMIEGNIGE